MSLRERNIDIILSNRYVTAKTNNINIQLEVHIADRGGDFLPEYKGRHSYVITY